MEIVIKSSEVKKFQKKISDFQTIQLGHTAPGAGTLPYRPGVPNLGIITYFGV